MSVNKNFDVIVVGGGHGGCEAAGAAAKLGRKVALVTFKENNIGQMSCNPSIGGVGKGIIVKEIDALDGLMPKAIDKAAIHYKTLNSSKGPAVWGPRAQADRKLYQAAMLELIKSFDNIEIIEAEVTELLVEENDVIQGVKTSVGVLEAPKVILTTGTFLGGKICIGDETFTGGRIDEKASNKLAEFIRSKGFKVARMKTGTPARIYKETINYDIIEAQPGDKPQPFSLMTDSIDVEQINCHMTYTDEAGHSIVRDNLHRSAIHASEVKSIGPRYCPSIDDKIVRFADKDRHQVFLEPEGLNSELVYPNGLSTSLPVEIQKKFYRSIKGLENAEFEKMGYVMEYDFVDPRELYPTLETKKVKGLYFAGQINGTTGYEEAAGQGLIAAINACLSSEGKEFITPRSESYIGVMISDLTTQGVSEPYRMMTSRSEYRIYLRPDNAYHRLTPKGIDSGVVSVEFKKKFLAMKEKVADLKVKLQEKKYTPNQLEKLGVELAKDGKIRSVFELLSIPQISSQQIKSICDFDLDVESNEFVQLKSQSLYKSLEAKIIMDIEKFNEVHEVLLPKDIDYFKVASLSYEARQRLSDAKPRSLADAKQVQGVTPSAISALQVHLRKVANG